MTNQALSFKRPETDLSSLEFLAAKFSNTDAAIAEIARLSAIQTLPRGAIHMISDIHGEDKKLRHVINNASGTLRPLVEQMFGKRMASDELKDFLKITFYPAEVTDQLEKIALKHLEQEPSCTEGSYALAEQAEICQAFFARHIGEVPMISRRLWKKVQRAAALRL